MTHLHPNTIRSFADRTASIEELIAASDHIAACEQCRAAVKQAASLDAGPKFAWLEGDRGWEHLAEEELSLAMNSPGSLPPDARAHLESCAECTRIVDDLRRERAAASKIVPIRAPSRLRLPLWAGIAAAAAVAAGLWISLRAPKKSDQPVIVAQLNDGGNVLKLNSAGQLEGLAAGNSTGASLLLDVMRTHRLPSPAQPLPPAQGAGHLRGEDLALLPFRVASPVDERTSRTPQFCWTAMQGTNSYQVTVLDGALHIAAQSPRTNATCWTSQTPLQPGALYTWTVTAHIAHGSIETPQPPLPEARFSVADQTALSELEAARNTTPPSPLLLAATYARLGMTSMARAELQKLEPRNPQSPLLRELEASLPQAADANAAR